MIRITELCGVSIITEIHKKNIHTASLIQKNASLNAETSKKTFEKKKTHSLLDIEIIII